MRFKSFCKLCTEYLQFDLSRDSGKLEREIAGTVSADIPAGTGSFPS